MVLCNDIVALDNSIDFLKIYDGKIPYYGGAQKWFKNNNLRKVGCSIVAAANIIAYLAVKSKNKSLFNYDNMSKENFLNHMESISRFIHPDVTKGVTSIEYFNKEVIEFCKGKGVNIKAHKITIKDDFNDVKDFIKTGLNENNPIALLMLENNVLKEFDYHWMTVTRFFDNIDKIYLDISTWGERRIFTLENFYNYSSFGALSYFEL